MHFFEQSLQCSMSEPISTTSASSTCQCASSDERMLTRSDWAGRIAVALFVLSSSRRAKKFKLRQLKVVANPWAWRTHILDGRPGA